MITVSSSKYISLFYNLYYKMAYVSIADYEEKYTSVRQIQSNIEELVNAANHNRLLSRYSKFISNNATNFIYFVTHPHELYTGLVPEKLDELRNYRQTIILHALIAVIAELQPGSNIAIPIYTEQVIEPIDQPDITINEVLHKYGYEKYYSYVVSYILRDMMEYSEDDNEYASEYYTIFLLHYDHFINESSLCYNTFTVLDLNSLEHANMLLALNIIEETFPLIRDSDKDKPFNSEFLYENYAIAMQPYNLTTPHLANFASYILYLIYTEKIDDAEGLGQIIGAAAIYDNETNIDHLDNYANINALLRFIPPARRATNKSITNYSIVGPISSNGIPEYRWNMLQDANRGIIHQAGPKQISDEIILLQIAKYGLYIDYTLYQLYHTIPEDLNDIVVTPAILLQMGFSYPLIMVSDDKLQEAAIMTGVMETWPTQNLVYYGHDSKIYQDGIVVNFHAAWGINLCISRQIHDYYAYLYEINNITHREIMDRFRMADATMANYNPVTYKWYITNIQVYDDEILYQLKYILPAIYNVEIMQQFMFYAYIHNLPLSEITLPSYYDYTLNNEELCHKYNIANIYTREQIMLIINEYISLDKKYTVQSHGLQLHTVQSYGMYYHCSYHSVKGNGQLYNISTQENMILSMNDNLSNLFKTEWDLYSNNSGALKLVHIRKQIIILSLIHAFDLWQANNLANFIKQSGIDIIIDA